MFEEILWSISTYSKTKLKEADGLSRWFSGKESACQCKRRRFSGVTGIDSTEAAEHKHTPFLQSLESEQLWPKTKEPEQTISKGINLSSVQSSFVRDNHVFIEVRPYESVLCWLSTTTIQKFRSYSKNMCGNSNMSSFTSETNEYFGDNHFI